MTYSPDNLRKAAALEPVAPEVVAKGVDRMRRLRFIRVAIWPLAVAGALVVNNLGTGLDPDHVAIFFFACLAPMEIVLQRARCPRCHARFIGYRNTSFVSGCGNCGLSLDKDGKRFFW